MAGPSHSFRLPDGQYVILSANGDIRVYLVQKMLNLLGTSPRLAEDGLHGPATQAALDKLVRKP